MLANGIELIKKRVYGFYQKEDISFEIAQWWREHIPKDAKIVSDHYRFAYVPDEYVQVEIFDRSKKNAVAQFCQLVERHKPQFIYVHENVPGCRPFPPVENILPAGMVKITKIFNNAGKSYQKWPNSRFIIYEVLR